MLVIFTNGHEEFMRMQSSKRAATYFWDQALMHVFPMVFNGRAPCCLNSGTVIVKWYDFTSTFLTHPLRFLFLSFSLSAMTHISTCSCRELWNSHKLIIFLFTQENTIFPPLFVQSRVLVCVSRNYNWGKKYMICGKIIVSILIP